MIKIQTPNFNEAAEILLARGGGKRYGGRDFSLIN